MVLSAIDNLVKTLKAFEHEFQNRVKDDTVDNTEKWLIEKVHQLTKNNFENESSLNVVFEHFPESESVLLLLLFHGFHKPEKSKLQSISQFFIDSMPFEFSNFSKGLLQSSIFQDQEVARRLVKVNESLLNNELSEAISLLLPISHEETNSPQTRFLWELYEKSGNFHDLNEWFLGHRDTCASQFMESIFSQHLHGDLETEKYTLYLRKLIRYISDDSSLAVRVWQEMFRYDLFEAANLAHDYRRYGSTTKEKGYQTLLLYEAEDVPDPQLSPEIKRASAIAEWAIAKSIDSALEPLKASKRLQLHGKPCRLSQLRILKLGIDANGQSITEFKSKITQEAPNLCALHHSSPEDAFDYVRQFLKKNSETVQIVRRGATHFLDLALQSKRFMLSENSLSFLTRNNSPLLSWQASAIESWAAHGRQGIVMAATGTGKSRLGIAAILEAKESSLPSLILSHRLAIKGQWKKDELAAIAGMRDIHGNLVKPAEMIFRLGDNVHELSSEDSPLDFYQVAEIASPVVLALDKSLSTRMDSLPNSWSDGSLLVADEVHRFGETAGQKVLQGSFTRRLGLTATLSYSDSSILDAFGETVVADYPIGKAIADGVVNEYNLLVVRGHVQETKSVFGNERVVLDLDNSQDHKSTRLLMSEALVRLEVAHRELLSKLDSMNYEFTDDFEIELIRIIQNRVPVLHKLAKRYLSYRTTYDRLARKTESSEGFLDVIAPKIAEYGKTLIFSNWRDQGKWISKKLTELGVAIEYLDGDSDYSARNSAFERLSGISDSEGIEAIVAPFILDEGVNIPLARIGIFMSNCPEGYRQIVQRMGRVLRKKGEGQRALLLLTVGIGTREDPGEDGSDRHWRDTMFGVMSEHSSKVRIVNIDDPVGIQRNLDELLLD